MYPDWLVNMVLVKKVNKKSRMCIDFNLNKTYPKDSYPLSRIDQLINVTSGHELTFMDAFFDYNQIWMASKNEIAFITDCGLYCYMIIPFGLKNISATYHHMMNKIFKNQISQNMKFTWMIC